MLNVAVIGAGLMGRNLARVAAGAGSAVRITDTNVDIIDSAMADLALHPNVSRARDLSAALDSAELVIEAVIENLEIKQNLFEAMSALSESAILASNTSVLPITAIAKKARKPERVVGTHWWNPPHLIPVVEVVRGELTSDTTMDRTVEILTVLGKTPVRVERDVPGFVGNRLQHALWREAIALVADGVCDAATVDLMVRNTIGLRLGEMGPLENADYVGLDLTLAIHDAVLPSLNCDAAPSSLLRELVSQNHLGAKTGRGFYDWPQGRGEDAAKRLSAHVANELANPARRDRTPIN